MAFRAFVFPLQELAKRRAAVAVAGFLFGREFSEGLPDLAESRRADRSRNRWSREAARRMRPSARP